MTDVRQLLMEANPVPRVDVPDALRAELFAEVRRTPPPERRLRRMRWPLPTILIALVAAGGVATAAGLLISQATKDKSAALASQPVIDPLVTGNRQQAVAYGPQMVATAHRIMARTPYPPHMRDPMDWASYAPSGAGSESVGSVERLIQHRAECLWRVYWVQSTERGETAAAAGAAAILRDAVDWSGVRSNRETTGPVAGRAFARRVARAAAAGDVDEVRALSRVDCSGIP